MGKKAKVVGSMSEWSGLLKDLFRQIDDGSINLKEFQLFLEHKNPYPNIFYAPSDLFLGDWKGLYSSIGVNCCLTSEIRVPIDPGGFNRVIIMARGITPQSAFDLCSENFSCLTHDNLDKIKSIRGTKYGSYAIRVRDCVEADEKFKKLSADQLEQVNISGITFEERLLLELFFFEETGKHLDINNWTLCSGSRYGNDFVPGVSWHGDMLCVSWFSSDDAYDNLRCRQVVS